MAKTGSVKTTTCSYAARMDVRAHTQTHLAEIRVRTHLTPKGLPIVPGLSDFTLEELLLSMRRFSRKPHDTRKSSCAASSTAGVPDGPALIGAVRRVGATSSGRGSAAWSWSRRIDYKPPAKRQPDASNLIYRSSGPRDRRQRRQSPWLLEPSLRQRFSLVKTAPQPIHLRPFELRIRCWIVGGALLLGF